MKITSVKGQNAIEYLLVFSIVVMAALVALAPRLGGFVSQGINRSLEESVEGIQCMAAGICYEPGGCPSQCGNGCCEQGEAASCPADCALTSSAQCMRNPSLGLCDITDCHEGCEIVTVDEKHGECHLDPDGTLRCEPDQPAYSKCVEIPCTGTTQSQCESQSHCIWR